MKENDKVFVSGATDELWIKDYGCISISSNGILLETPKKSAKKVLVMLDYIDGERNVTVLVRKSKLMIRK